MSSELDKAIEEANEHERHRQTPTGDCPNCNGRDTVEPTDHGARCALCKTLWNGDAYATDMKEQVERARKQYEMKPYEEPKPFAQYVALAEWSETPEGKKTLKAITKVLRRIFSPSGDEWKDE